MKCNRLNILLVFSALLMFAFTGELAAQLSITLEPDGERIGINENFGLTATLLDGATALEDSAVEFRMVSAYGGASPTGDTTNSSGVANSTYYSQVTSVERTDTVYVIGIYNADADTVSDTITVEVVAKPASLTLAPTGQMIGIGEDLDLTATLLDQLDGVVVDSTVTFSVVSGGGSVSPSSDATDGSGEAITVYTAGSSEGTVRVAARGIYSNGAGADTLVDTLDILIDAKPASLALTPVGQTIGIGESLDLTATLLDQLDGPVVDSTVTFSLASGGGSISHSIDTTNGSGETYTTYTAGGSEETVRVAARGVYSNSVGTDTLVDTLDIVVSAKPVSLTLAPTGRSIVLNEQLLLTAALLDQLDSVVVDSTVTFSVITGGGSVSPLIDTTNVDGEAYTIYTAGSSAGTARVAARGIYSNGAGTDTLVDTLDIVVVNAPDNLYWNVATATLDLEDDEAFTARITLSGAGVGGLMVDFSLSPGLGSVDPESGTTSSTGYVATTYTASTAAGTDTLIAVWTDEDLRAELTDTVIITINPGPPTSLNVNPLDTLVVVTEDAVVVAELLDDYLNHVDATSTDQVTFTSNGNGGFGDKEIDDAGCITVAYTTDDSTATDTITTQLVGHTTDYTRVRTIGGAPTGMYIWIGDTIVVVGGIDPGYVPEKQEYFNVALFDQYGNKTIWSDYYADETHAVALTVSEGGGQFQRNVEPYDIIDTAYVDSAGVSSPGTAEANYLTSRTTGVYTITCTSGAAQSSRNIVQICDVPDSLYLTNDSLGIPAGSDTLLTAMLFDQYGNHCPADDEREFDDVVWYVEDGDGWLEEEYIDYENDHNWKCRFHSYELTADTSHVGAYYYDDEPYDIITIFSAEPGDFHHYDVTILNIPPEAVFDDKAYVSDGSDVDTAYLNGVLIEAQDGNNIRLYTYTNPDTVTLTLDGTSAEASQVTWFVANLGGPTQPVGDTVVGLTAPIPPGYFGTPGPYGGLCFALVANQVAETVTITATDTAGHTGTSPELTWLPTGVVGFNVALEGGLTTITAIDDTVNMEVTAIDEFGNTTGMGLPLNVVLSATRPVEFLGGEMQLMENPVSLFPMVATQEASDLVLRIADYLVPSINGSSDPIIVNPSGIDEEPIVEGPVVSSISARFGSGDISYAVATDGEVSIKVYNKVGMQVGSLVDGAVSRGYYQASLKALNLSSDIYFVVMQGPGIDKKIKATLIK
jgi:hypothetical protein